MELIVNFNIKEIISISHNSVLFEVCRVPISNKNKLCEKMKERQFSHDLTVALIRKMFVLPMNCRACIEHETGNLYRGKPYCMIEGKRHNMSLSISHNNGYCASIVSNEYLVGIDIQKKLSQLTKEMRQVAFSKHELMLLENGISETELWCCKEAIGKLLGCGLRYGFQSISFQNIDLENGKAVVFISDKIKERYLDIVSNQTVISVWNMYNEEFYVAVCIKHQ